MTAYYGGPYAKDYFKTLNGWYRKGYVDKDMFLAKADQITAKISNGGAAFWMSMGAADTQIQDSLLKINPDAWVRPIPLPQYKSDLPPYVQTTQPGPGQSLAINKNFKQLDDLIGYLDYLYSDEGQDLVMWGDGEGTVWKVQDGKKVFIDDTMYKAVLDTSGTLTDSNGKSAKSYGLTFYSPYTVVFNKNWLMNPYHYSYSYPNKLIGWNEVCRAAGENTIDVSGKWSNPIPRGELAAKANNFFWAQSWDPSAKMILSDDDTTFEKNWNDVYTAFMKEVGDYKKMQDDMAVTFTP